MKLPGFRRPLRPLASQDAYARWAASYADHAHNPLMAAEEAALCELLPPLAGRDVLDLASGSGRWGRLALERGAARVLAVDNSAPMLRASRLPERIAASLEALPLPAACADVVICGLALGHLPRLDTALAEVARVLRPGGAALISDFHPYLALSGAQRTFTAADGRVYAVEHHIHLIEDYWRAAQAAHLTLDALREPHTPSPVAGGLSLRQTPTTPFPVVLALRLRR